jgi:RNA polymerase sigma-70 factor (ECF subfamily)
MPTLRLVHGSGALPDDDEIKALARSDRRAAADAVVRRYREPIFHHAAWILKNWEEAVDVTQEVFIKSMREPRFFEPEFKMKAWLYRVTSNLCFNLVRDRRRRTAILESSPHARVEEADQPDTVFVGERQQRILAAIDKLSDDHREILMLRYYSDLSYAEISDTLGIKLGTVMSRLSRAKGALAEYLDEQGVDPDGSG